MVMEPVMQAVFLILTEAARGGVLSQARTILALAVEAMGVWVAQADMTLVIARVMAVQLMAQ